MKKFLTFFAVMFALLGWSLPVSAANWTFYVDTSSRPSWSTAYLYVANDYNGGTYYSCIQGTETSSGSKVYKFSITSGWDDLKYISFASYATDMSGGKRTNASQFTYGDDLVGTLSTDNSNNTWKVENNACYKLAASGCALTSRTTNYTPVVDHLAWTFTPKNKISSSGFSFSTSNPTSDFTTSTGVNDNNGDNNKPKFILKNSSSKYLIPSNEGHVEPGSKTLMKEHSGDWWIVVDNASSSTNYPISLSYEGSSVYMTIGSTESNPPYIYIDGASKPFTMDGSDWVYTVDASTGKKLFRVQNSNNTTALGTNVSNVAICPNGQAANGQTYTATYNGEWEVPSSALGYEIPTEVFGNYSGKIALSNGSYTIKLNSDLSKITFSKNGPVKPATPVLPAAATGNKVVIPAISGATIYYTESATGDPSTDWTPYPTGGIALTKGYTTIRAAAYKDGLGWSDVTTAKTYTYTLPVVNISINVHTGMATLTPQQALSTLPAGANAVILYSCGSDAPNNVYTEGTPINMESACVGQTSYSIKAIVRAWGDGADHATAVSGQSVDSDVRNAQWVGPAEVRRVCLWGYNTSGNPTRLGEFSKQADGSYTISYSPVSGTNSSNKSQRYFIRVVMNHDDPNNDNADTGGTYYALGNTTNGVATVASGTEYTDFNSFVPSSSDARGMFFDGTDRDAVKLTLKGTLVDYNVDASTPCKRFVPNSVTPEWNALANIKEVKLVDANGKVLCTLTQNLATGEENIWSGVTTENLPKAANNNPNTAKFHFVADTKDGKKYYSLGSEANYWIGYGRYDLTTTPAVTSSTSSSNYFCVNAGPAIAEVAIVFDGTNASVISVSPYDSSISMDISGNPNAPKITGEGSEVGSWDTSRQFTQSDNDSWVYTFTATESIAKFLIYGSKGNLYAPVGFSIGSPTTVWRQVPATLTATQKPAYAAKLSGLQVGARYRLLLKDVSGDVQLSIEALPESVRKVKSVELWNGTANAKALDFAYDENDGLWNAYPLSWTGNPDNSNSVASDKYYVKVTIGYEGEGDASDYVRYVAWENNSNYWLTSTSQQNNKPYTYTNLSDGKYFRVSVNGEYYVQMAFDESTCEAIWMGVATERQSYTYTPQVNCQAWSLSDDAILPRGETKYFYMSAIQNDNRLSPEWELVKQTDGKYVLDDFVVVPAAQFIIRGVTKDDNGSLTVHDYGWDETTPYHIYADSDFKLSTTTQQPVDSKVSAKFTMKVDKGRGFFWNIGATMVRLEFDPSASTDNLTATINFAYPSTLKSAPKHGFPWVGLTSSNIQALRGSNQTYQFAAALGNSGISTADLANIGISSAADLNNSFTNAFIQWTADGKPYIYDSHVADKSTNNVRIYYVETGDNRNTTAQPQAGQVMSSTILPPRNAPQFQMITTKGIQTPSADALTFKYIGKDTRQFEQHGNKTRATEFAVYEIENIELQGMFKVFTGYGARKYGETTNGLTWFANWGVGDAEGSSNAYANDLISSTSALPMNGGGQVINNTVNGHQEVSRKQWNHSNLGNSGDFDGYDDNTAGKYFRLDNSQYVTSLRFYLALESDTEDRNSKTFHNPYGSDANIYNDGRNYSWLDVHLEAERPVIILNKQGSNTGVGRYYLNADRNTERPTVKSYKTKLIKVDPETFEYDEETGVVTAGNLGQVAGNTYNVESLGLNFIEETSYNIPNLAEGTYYAFIYDVVYDTSGGSYTIEPTHHWNISQPITVFSVKQGRIYGEQLVGKRDDAKVYHPTVHVYPDIQNVVKNLPPTVDLANDVSAIVTVGNVRNTSYLLDASNNAIEKKNAVDPTATDIYYVVTKPYVAPADGNVEQEGEIKVYYPKGYFSAERANTQNFDVVNSRINALTHLALDVDVVGADKPAMVTAEVMTYMPAGKLYGELVADKHEDGTVKFNSLRVTRGDDVDPSVEQLDDYARIRFADRDAGDTPCYIGSVEGTEVWAQVYYVGKTGDVALFAEDALLDMKANPDDESIYTAKRLKIGGIPYETEFDAADDLATDIDGTQLNLRQTQHASFKVVLTYKNVGEAMPGVQTRTLTTELTYGDENLFSPRQGLRDVLTQADADQRGNGGIARDVTAISESFVENYGGLFTNIEDAHVALEAVSINPDLVGEKTFQKWYMDHGDKWPGTGAVNPHNPAAHRALGNTKRDGTGEYTSVNEVHPLLRGQNALTGSDGEGNPNGFRNDSQVNNAWWNERARVAPEFHVADHIKGDFIREGNTINGKITGWKEESTIQKPAQHSEYWAGVKAGNDEAYNVFNGSTVIKVNDLQTGKEMDVDIRDPKHSYYGMNSHFSSTPGLRTAFHLGEMPLNANDIMALYGNESDPHGVSSHLGVSFADLRAVAIPIHENISEVIANADYKDGGKASVTIDGTTYTLDIPVETPWNIDNIWAARAELAFKPSNAAGLEGKSPAEAIFEAANNHMIFKVRHVNHESWFVPGGGLQHDLKTRPLWAAFEGVNVGGKTIEDYTTDKAKEHFVMSIIRMSLDDYCPLAYDVRYVYPFLTSDKFVTAEDYNNASKAKAARKARATTPGSIAAALGGVAESDVSDIVARDKGRVPFFDGVTTSPDEVVPTAISDVNDDIRGAGFSIVYNRAAGTVTITADGDRQLKDAAVYDATGASLVMGTSADRVNDQTIVLDVRNIARGAYVVSTNLGGAKFMK